MMNDEKLPDGELSLFRNWEIDLEYLGEDHPSH